MADGQHAKLKRIMGQFLLKWFRFRQLRPIGLSLILPLLNNFQWQAQVFYHSSLLRKFEPMPVVLLVGSSSLVNKRPLIQELSWNKVAKHETDLLVAESLNSKSSFALSLAIKTPKEVVSPTFIRFYRDVDKFSKLDFLLFFFQIRQVGIQTPTWQVAKTTESSLSHPISSCLCLSWLGRACWYSKSGRSFGFCLKLKLKVIQAFGWSEKCFAV